MEDAVSQIVWCRCGLECLIASFGKDYNTPDFQTDTIMAV